MDEAKIEIDKAKAEMDKAKAEMDNARAEMDKAEVEMDETEIDEMKEGMDKAKEKEERGLLIFVCVAWIAIVGGSFYLHEKGINILGFLVLLGVVLFIIGFFKIMCLPIHGKLK